MFSLQNKRILLVSLYIFVFLFITSQARNMPKETTTTKGVDKKGGDEKLVPTTTENVAPSPISTTTEKVEEKSVTRTENDVPRNTREVENDGHDKMATRTENMDATSTEDLNMMDYSAAQNKNPTHN